MKRIAIIAALLAIVTPLAAKEPARAPLLVREPTGMTGLYRRSAPVIADYSAAMLRYRTSGRADSFVGRGYPFAWRGTPVGGNWTWVAVDGSIVRRLEVGTFRLLLADRPGNLFVEITCSDAGWPMFACSDDHMREMSAPDLSTIVFDDIVYSRTLDTEPPDSPTPENEPPSNPEDSLPESQPTGNEE